MSKTDLEEKPFDAYKANRRRTIVRRRFEAREFIDSLKAKPCKDCGGKFAACQMDFVRPDANGHQVSRMLLKSKARIREDSDKYDLVCANCSRLRIWKRQRDARSGVT